jgi:superfamily II DNA/RNA helicase
MTPPPAAPETSPLSRDDIAERYLEALPYTPYPVQEEAILGWFTHDQGVLVCAPTGTGKTLIAEAAMFEALHAGKVAYYTTPLIALTEQKFKELQDAAVRWGFTTEHVGLITGNRKVNPEAPVRVVVAEVLLNRLLTPEQYDFDRTIAVVMDEFHSFNDPERGVVWELSLALLPRTVRLLLLSATVGNSVEFLGWLYRSHGRNLQLVQSQDRKVPLSFHWIGDQLLAEQLEWMQDGDEARRRTPALIFSFNRAECWTIAEQLKGRNLLAEGQQRELTRQLEQWDWKIGAGPKLKQLLLRGVGVHHAGMLPKYRRRVEQLFQQKLLSVCLCTETLAAGINLPARSVVLTTLLKGPPGKMKVVDASSAHQIFGRAGRPQFDTEGFVYALAHEDDVRIARWKAQYDQIPEDTKDPNLIKAKKNLKKKMPTRRSNIQYWNEEQFQKLVAAPPLKLESKGNLPWRLLAFLLQHDADVQRLRGYVRKRLLDSRQQELAQQRLTRMLLTLHVAGFVDLEPSPPADRYEKMQRDWEIPEAAVAELAASGDFPPQLPASGPDDPDNGAGAALTPDPAESPETDLDDFGTGILDDEPVLPAGQQPLAASISGQATAEPPESDSTLPQPAPEPTDVAAPESAPSAASPSGTFGALLQAALQQGQHPAAQAPATAAKPAAVKVAEPAYEPLRAVPAELLPQILQFRTCNSLYASFLLDHLGLANAEERLQALESVLEVPGSLLPLVRAPGPDRMPFGPLARYRLHELLLSRGLATQADLDPRSVEPEFDSFGKPIRRWPLALADKLKRLFDAELPGVEDLRITPVWIAGDLVLTFGGNFQKYVTSRDLTKQEGLIFRHLLRLILLCQEFAPHCPRGESPERWQRQLRELTDLLTTSCRTVDPESTDHWLERAADEGALL